MTLRVEVPGDKVISLDKVVHIGKVANIEQCKCNNTFGAELKKKETTLSRRLKEYLKASWAFRTKITVEPFVICYILPSVLAGLAVQNLCLEKSCLVNLGYDKDTCTHIMQGRTLNYTGAERDVQVMVTKMTAWSYPLQTALPGVLTLFVGAWTDRTGNRKIFMVLPILGKLISAIGLILSTIFFFQVDLNVTALIEGLPPAIAGGRVAMTMAVYSYITDITSESERTFRLGILTAIVTLGRPVGLALSGIMTNRFGYYGVFTIACTCYLIGFVYIVLRLKTNKIMKKVDDCKEKKLVMNVFAKDFLATVNVAFKSRPKSSRLQLILIMLAYMLIVGPVIGEAQMTYWFTRYKFKFTEVDYSLFLTYSVLIGSIGSFVTIYFFTKRWKIDDSIIGVVACVSRISGGVLYALAPSRTIYFIGPVLDMFSSASATSLRSMATKLVNADEIGKTSSLISISEALVPVIYSPIYSKVYLATLSRFPGAFYLISAALAVPAIVIFIILHLIRQREWQQENTSTVEPEKKPKDDEMTRF